MNGVFGELLSDKTKDTSWYGDYAYSVHSSFPWFFLGGYISSSSYAGALGSSSAGGGAHANGGVRVVLS